MTRRSDLRALGDGSNRLSLLLLAPLVPFAYPVAAGILSRSEVPLFFGRYSASFLGFNVLMAGVVGLLFTSWFRGSHRGLQLGYLLVILCTLLVPMNSQLLALPAMLWALPVLRLVTGATIVLADFDWQRRKLGRSRGIEIGLGSVLVTLSLIDLMLLTALGSLPEEPRLRELREDYDLTQIGLTDIVLVGDSFVWGQGVSTEERFGNRLEALISEDDRTTRVYSLGIRGIGLPQYIQILEDLPASVEAARVVVVFYLNDMPAHETMRVKLHDLSIAIGRGVPSIRLVGDQLAKLAVPDVAAYHDFLVESHGEGHSTFAARWEQLGQRFAQLQGLAAEHSRARPLMLILPIMVDFEDYPLDESHARLAERAREAGFDVLDLLPVFREHLGDGDAHRNAPDDSHFDAETHALLAVTLRKAELFPRD